MIIHEYWIDLGPGGIGPRRRLGHQSYEKETKQEVNEYLRAKMGESRPTVLVLETKEEKTTLVLEKTRRGKRQLMRLFGEEDAILAASVISCMPLTPKSGLIETINLKIHERFIKQDFYDLKEKEDDCLFF